MHIEQRLEAMGLYLPEPAIVPPGVTISFAWARSYGTRVYIAGHRPQAADGSLVRLTGVSTTIPACMSLRAWVRDTDTPLLTAPPPPRPARRARPAATG